MSRHWRMIVLLLEVNKQSSEQIYRWHAPEENQSRKRNPYLPLQGIVPEGRGFRTPTSLNAQQHLAQTIYEQEISLQTEMDSSAVCKDSSSRLDSDDLFSQSDLNELVHSSESPLLSLARELFYTEPADRPPNYYANCKLAWNKLDLRRCTGSNTAIISAKQERGYPKSDSARQSRVYLSFSRVNHWSRKTVRWYIFSGWLLFDAL